MKFVNKICPNCKNPNYMVSLGDSSKVYQYRCMNCNRYFNNDDFDKPLQPVWKSKYMNTKVDTVEVVRCGDCKHVMRLPRLEHDDTNGRFIACRLNNFKGIRTDDWFCPDGERE